MLKPLVPKFRPDLSARLKDIAENQVPAKLKPIVGIIHQEDAEQAGGHQTENWLPEGPYFWAAVQGERNMSMTISVLYIMP